ncbi:hypothetical protein G6F56_003715 [Rhizopus delemar]|nr:hypothetical protein G6F56_003715 [Rhizopus delemar]
MSKHRKKQSIFSFSDDEEDDQTASVKPLPNHAVERSELNADDFNPDSFLSSRRHLGLERMKVELNVHLKQLKAELVELINKDYQDFVNLSTNLKGVDKNLQDFKQPLNHIENQVISVLKLLLNIHESISKVEYLLDINTEIVQDNIGKQVERAAIEYNQMQHLVKRGKDLAFVKENEWRITRIKETLEQKLLKTLSTALLQVRAGELTRSTKQSLIQCLRTYSLIDQTETGERIIREQFVRLYLEKIIQPKVLLNSQDAHPLAEMYKKIISFVEVDLQPILDITQKTLKGSNYEVLVNSLWVEISYRISQECKMIFAPGQTSVFHKNYTTTVSFLSRLEGLCSSKRSTVYLRNHSSYIEFMKKWQLPVYFQLKFREIVTHVEGALSSSSTVKDKNNTLTETKIMIDTIQKCWSDQVYLYALAHRFYKLTLQLIKRYNVWVVDRLQNANNSTKSTLYSNVQQLIEFTQKEIPKLILPKLPINMQDQPSIIEGLNDALNELKLIIKK